MNDETPNDEPDDHPEGDDPDVTAPERPAPEADTVDINTDSGVDIDTDSPTDREPIDVAPPADTFPDGDGVDEATLDPPLPSDLRTARPDRLYRDPSGPVAGVATGVARFFGFSPLLVQLLFVVLAALGGLGIVLYVMLWLVLPTVGPDGVLVRPSSCRIIAGAAILLVSLIAGAAAIGIPRAGAVGILLIIIGVLLLSQREGSAADLTTQFRETFAPQPVRPGAGATLIPNPPAGDPRSPYAWATPRTQPGTPEPLEPAPPRKPITSLTLAIAVLATGIMLVVASLAPVSAAAAWGIFALVCGAGLVASAFFGRGAWLLLIPASISLIGMGAAVGAETLSLSKYDWSLGEVNITIFDQRQLSDDYSVGVGELNIDLTEMSLTDDASFDISVGVGEANIVVPEDMNVVLRGDVGQGEIRWFGEDTSSVNGSLERRRRSGSEGGPELVINADVGVGELSVKNG